MTAVTACSDDDADFPGLDDQSKAGYITLNVKNSRAVSKATMADDDNNENVIRSLVLCLYPADNPSGKPKFVKKYDFNKQTQVVIQEKFSRELADALFPSGATTCGALVVANLPDADAEAITVDTALDDIRRIAVSSEVFKTVGIPDDFVMDGDATVTRTGANTAQDRATGNVDLRRAAARISLAASVEESVTDAGGQKWKPLTNQIKLILNNGVYRSAVNPANHTNAAGDYFNTPWANSTDIDTESANKYPYRTKVPFYTYPNSWVPDAADSHMTYITLMVPWQKEGDGTTQFQNFYYMVPVVKTNELVRNVAYQVNINVGVLGSSTPDEPFVISPASYTAVDWSDINMDITIEDSRYLEVDQNTYTMDNVEDIVIPYYTSHESYISDIQMTYYRYYVTTEGTETPITITKAQIDESNRQASPDSLCAYALRDQNAELAGGDYLYIRHPLNLWAAINTSSTSTTLSNLNIFQQSALPTANIPYYLPAESKRISSSSRRPEKEPAYSRYKIEVTIKHKTNESFSQTIVIWQYPQMYIESVANYSGSRMNLGGTYRDLSGPIYGNSYINGNQATSGVQDWYRPSGNASSGSNSNPNMYLIHITQLNVGTRYIIGDPRIAMNLNYSFENAPHVNGGTSTLKNYKGADENKDQYIAPILRVASSWGKSMPMSKDLAERRCASYQELDCPAGRWRLPTRSELEYISSLSDKQYIPLLFTLHDVDAETYGGKTQNGYWTAQGRVVQKPSKTGGVLKLSKDQNNASVRCVYDEWYWKDSKVKQDGTIKYKTNRATYDTGIPYYPFTWGDE